MKLLLTRPAADSEALAALLKAQGHTAMIEPMLEVKPLEIEPPPLDGVTGLLFTSANGVRAFAAKSDRRDIAAYAVGDRTAAAAREAGFTRVESAEGDVEALASLVERLHKPEDGTLLHISGAVRAGNLAGVLSAKGYKVEHVALYEAVAAMELTAPTRVALASGGLDGVLLFSPRTAKHFVQLIQAANLTDQAARLQAWCLSRAVADALAPLPLAASNVAPEPIQASLLALIGPAATAAVPAPVAPPAAKAKTPPPPQHRGRSWLGVTALVLLAIGAAASAPQWLPLVEPLWHKSAPKQIAEAPKATAQDVAPPVAPSNDEAPKATITEIVRPGATPPPPAPDQTSASTADTSDLAQRLDKLESALEELRVEAASAAPKGTLTELQGRVEALEHQAADLAARPSIDPKQLQDLASDAKRQGTALSQLNDRVTPLEARINQKAQAIRNDRTLVLAAGQIRDALAGSGPFASPVAVIRAVAPDDGALDGPLKMLEAHAKGGVPSRVRLAQDLDDLPAKLAEPAPLATDAGIWDRVTDKLGHLVTIRRVDDGSHAMPAGPDRLIAEAQQALAAGDLAGAIQRVKQIDAAGAQPWLDAAQARLDCEQAVQALDAEAVKRLSGGPEGGAAE